MNYLNVISAVDINKGQLTKEQILYILYVKGDYQEYEDVEDILLSSYYNVQKKNITASLKTSFKISIVATLGNHGLLPLNPENQLEWFLFEMKDLANKENFLQPYSYDQWLYWQIKYCSVDQTWLIGIDDTMITRNLLKLDVITEQTYQKEYQAAELFFWLGESKIAHKLLISAFNLKGASFKSYF